MWKNRNVWIVLAGEFITGLGLWTSIIANLEFMQQHVPSDFMKSLILFVGLLAGVLVGPAAGRIIDTRSKKSVLLFSGILRMVSVGFMFLALYYESVWWMVLFAILLQIAAAFSMPTLQALLPMIVSEKDLLSINGVYMNVTTVSRILGTALAGLMLAVMSLYSLYTASLVAYVLLLISTFFLDVKEDENAGAGHQKQNKSSFKDVIPVLRGLPIAIVILALSIVPMLFIGGFNLMVINISEMQNDPQIKGLLYAVEGTSFIIAALLVKRLSEGRNLLKLLFAIAIVIACSHLSLYFADSKVMSLVSFGLFGIGAGCFFPISATILQTRVPKEYHGRFFSFRNMFDRVLFQVILLGTGLFLDTIGFHQMVLWFGAISILLALYGVLKMAKTVEFTEKSGVSQQA
ncbi:MFS transporter [Effusibacillus lacus]|uniref:MFS transporter n=1 Tax=Effusibacillus lacus TaxID=1348429 RepID=A0A292YCF8_9BACL|nr:MFS transporter [Effusibacillus lacus]TCS75119.1 MFS transporter [Effusibacillus lacus]GAX89072.1 MFS transporter [Effusibacillus lacus]